jgi:hypothetical protein
MSFFSKMEGMFKDDKKGGQSGQPDGQRGELLFLVTLVQIVNPTFLQVTSNSNMVTNNRRNKDMYHLNLNTTPTPNNTTLPHQPSNTAPLLALLHLPNFPKVGCHSGIPLVKDGHILNFQ